MHYKDQNNSLYFLDDSVFEYLLPTGCIQITDEEAETIRNSQVTAITLPSRLTMRQTRLALLNAGLLDQVMASISQMPQASQIEWEFASSVDRDNPLVASLAAALQLTTQQLDNLFIEGSKL